GRGGRFPARREDVRARRRPGAGRGREHELLRVPPLRRANGDLPRRRRHAARRRARRAAARSGAAAGAAGGSRRHRPAGCRGRSRLAGGAGPRGRRPAGFGRAGRAAALTVRVLLLALSLLQQPRAERPDVRAGLDTLYGGGFPAAAVYFAELAGRDSTDPAPLPLAARAYIWWAAALTHDAFADELLD